MKMFTSLLLVILLAAGCLIASAQSLPPQGWAYRRIITITNTGPQLTNYQVRIDLNASSFDFSKAKTDGSDLRVTIGQSDAPVPFWIEKWGGGNGTIWVRVPALPTGQTTLRLYYGNAAARNESNGNLSFDFFDDFASTSWTRGYFSLGPDAMVLRQDQSFEDSAPHTLSAVKANSGGYVYWGYYGPQGSGWIGLARSNDLRNWVKNSSALPSLSGHGERWPSVLLVNNMFYMAHTVNFDGNSNIVLRTSTDGINFGPATTLVAAESGMKNQNPALFQDPKDGSYYLYWYRGNDSSVFELNAKRYATIDDLKNANASSLVTVISTRPNVIAAPQVMYDQNIYYLAVETLEGGLWRTRLYGSEIPTGGFRELQGSPVLADDAACFFQHIFDNTLHAYYCKRTGVTWTVNYRTANLSAGRPPILAPNLIKWTPSGGNWQLTSSSSGSQGLVLQGNTFERQILVSSFSSTGYILEASARQISGRVWGLGVSAANAANLYSVNVYNDLDPQPNLYLYRWSNGTASQLASASIGPIAPNAWQRLSVKIYASTIEIWVNNQRKIQMSDPGLTSGPVALYGESGTIAQFDDVFVRKYAAPEPTVALGPEQTVNF
jgi:hypothetical protein